MSAGVREGNYGPDYMTLLSWRRHVWGSLGRELWEWLYDSIVKEPSCLRGSGKGIMGLITWLYCLGAVMSMIVLYVKNHTGINLVEDSLCSTWLAYFDQSDQSNSILMCDWFILVIIITHNATVLFLIGHWLVTWSNKLTPWCFSKQWPIVIGHNKSHDRAT